MRLAELCHYRGADPGRDFVDSPVSSSGRASGALNECRRRGLKGGTQDATKDVFERFYDRLEVRKIVHSEKSHNT